MCFKSVNYHQTFYQFEFISILIKFVAFIKRNFVVFQKKEKKNYQQDYDHNYHFAAETNRISFGEFRRSTIQAMHISETYCLGI